MSIIDTLTKEVIEFLNIDLESDPQAYEEIKLGVESVYAIIMAMKKHNVL